MSSVGVNYLVIAKVLILFSEIGKSELSNFLPNSSISYKLAHVASALLNAHVLVPDTCLVLFVHFVLFVLLLLIKSILAK